MGEAPDGAEGRTFHGEDWYAEDLAAARFVDCAFVGVDLSE
ncbi:MAG: pentapeptide repeat-containing protein, partial [Nocardioides sp.]|nr:pentapeptide repeat-containing protein [Nocardioides sp.]